MKIYQSSVLSNACFFYMISQYPLIDDQYVDLLLVGLTPGELRANQLPAHGGSRAKQATVCRGGVRSLQPSTAANEEPDGGEYWLRVQTGSDCLNPQPQLKHAGGQKVSVKIEFFLLQYLCLNMPSKLYD